VGLALGLKKSAVAERCAAGYFLSAKRDGPRGGWTVAACCVAAERETEWPCGVCGEGGSERI